LDSRRHRASKVSFSLVPDSQSFRRRHLAGDPHHLTPNFLNPARSVGRQREAWIRLFELAGCGIGCGHAKQYGEKAGKSYRNAPAARRFISRGSLVRIQPLLFAICPTKSHFSASKHTKPQPGTTTRNYPVLPHSHPLPVVVAVVVHIPRQQPTEFLRYVCT
jgi:hypothetical protein